MAWETILSSRRWNWHLEAKPRSTWDKHALEASCRNVDWDEDTLVFKDKETQKSNTTFETNTHCLSCHVETKIRMKILDFPIIMKHRDMQIEHNTQDKHALAASFRNVDYNEDTWGDVCNCLPCGSNGNSKQVGWGAPISNCVDSALQF